MDGKQDNSEQHGVVVPIHAKHGAYTTNPRHALQVMGGHLTSQIALCQDLENIADSLPDNVNSQDCLHVARSIFPTVRKAHEFEENELFPMLRAHFGDDRELTEALNRLHFEHWEDESYAEELADSLMNFVTHRDRANPEALAYMLRGFFESLRRHIAFEQDHLCPIVKNMEVRDDVRN